MTGGRNDRLAGDYMGMPWTDGAAETGVWAAEQILAFQDQGEASEGASDDRKLSLREGSLRGRG